MSSSDARSELQREHAASSRPDTERVHPSWFIRALKTESEAVKLAVTSHATPRLHRALLRGLEIEPDQLKSDYPPDPDVVGWLMALWAERLVGAVPERGDPPVVVALTRLGPNDLGRLIKVCGLVKHAFALEGNKVTKADEEETRFTPIDRVRLSFFQRRIGKPDARLGPMARQDLQYIEGDWRRAHSRLGLVTIGRLLESVELVRAQWAVQHLPYGVAKLVRKKMVLPMPSRAVIAWETWVLKAAWARLLSELRITSGRDWLPDLSKGDDS
jgi:hypothetical protein